MDIYRETIASLLGIKTTDQELQDSREVAIRLSEQLWGKRSSFKTLYPGIWQASCDRHGGLVVDTKVFPELSRPAAPTLDTCFDRMVTVYETSSYYRPEEQHFAAFEQDVDWAFVPYLFHARENLQMHPSVALMNPYAQALDELDEAVKDLIDYHPLEFAACERRLGYFGQKHTSRVSPCQLHTSTGFPRRIVSEISSSGENIFLIPVPHTRPDAGGVFTTKGAYILCDEEMTHGLHVDSDIRHLQQKLHDIKQRGSLSLRDLDHIQICCATWISTTMLIRAGERDLMEAVLNHNLRRPELEGTLEGLVEWACATRDITCNPLFNDWIATCEDIIARDSWQAAKFAYEPIDDLSR